MFLSKKIKVKQSDFFLKYPRCRCFSPLFELISGSKQFKVRGTILRIKNVLERKIKTISFPKESMFKNCWRALYKDDKINLVFRQLTTVGKHWFRVSNSIPDFSSSFLFSLQDLKERLKIANQRMFKKKNEEKRVSNQTLLSSFEKLLLYLLFGFFVLGRPTRF